MTGVGSGSFVVEVAGRLDRCLADHVAQLSRLPLSRSQLQRCIEQGLVRVNEKVVTKAGEALRQGDKVSFDELFATPSGTAPEPVAMDLRILYQDSDLVVVDKPHALTMHPGAGAKQPTLAGGLLALLGDSMREAGGSPDRPGIVHRLDKDTSGIVVVARNPAAHAALAKQFAHKSVERLYRALLAVTPRANRTIQKSDSGTVSTPFGRDPVNRKRMAVLQEGGKEAVTHWTVIERMNHGVLVELRLATGRTHQIRVHMESIGSPIVGDPVYHRGMVLPPALLQRAKEFGRQALHAAVLSFEHPRSGERLRFESNLPPDLENLIDLFRRSA
jgi:23S rRNA pseudouridine1911/1915/1917 synthase